MMQTNFSPFPILTTDRLILRQLESADAAVIFAHRTNDTVNTYLDGFRHSSIAETKAFIDRVQRETAIGKTILWAITRKGSNKFIGAISLWNISEEECKAEAGYTLEPEFHKLGYMHEALVKVIDFGFNTMKLMTIDAYTHENNYASIQLLRRNRFIQGAIPEKAVGNNRVFFSLTIQTDE
jgi:ribosomal-protein-alanine N-acetyltransferase